MAGIVDATDSIIQRFMEQWTADAGTVVGGSAPVVVNEATEADMKPHPRDTTAPWARITVRHATGRARSLGNRHFAKTGSVYVNIFVPFQSGDAYTTAQRLAEVAKNAYEGKRAGGVWFPSVSTPERGREGSWWQVDCIASFQYHEFKS